MEYKIKESKRAKHLRLNIYFDGSITLTKPLGVSDRAVFEFIKEKKDWIEKTLLGFNRSGNKDLLNTDRSHYLEYKERARKVIMDKLLHWSEVCNVKYNKVFIRRQRTLWGSCSSKKNLNFNYKLIFLPEELVDYVIIHELCHTKELNHSKNFWKLVSDIIPDYREKEIKLKKIFKNG